MAVLHFFLLNSSLIYIIFSMIKNKQNERKFIETRFFELLLKAETDQKHEERVQEQKWKQTVINKWGKLTKNLGKLINLKVFENKSGNESKVWGNKPKFRGLTTNWDFKSFWKKNGNGSKIWS